MSKEIEESRRAKVRNEKIKVDIESFINRYNDDNTAVIVVLVDAKNGGCHTRFCGQRPHLCNALSQAVKTVSMHLAVEVHKLAEKLHKVCGEQWEDGVL